VREVLYAVSFVARPKKDVVVAIATASKSIDAFSFQVGRSVFFCFLLEYFPRRTSVPEEDEDDGRRGKYDERGQREEERAIRKDFGFLFLLLPVDTKK